MKFTKPQAKSAHSSDEIDKLRKAVSDRGLCGLANNKSGINSSPL
jgi:hypothetical protein